MFTNGFAVLFLVLSGKSSVQWHVGCGSQWRGSCPGNRFRLELFLTHASVIETLSAELLVLYAKAGMLEAMQALSYKFRIVFGTL